MDVDLENRGDKPYQSSGYFVRARFRGPNSSEGYPSYTRLVWCINGRAKGIDVGWFGSSSGFWAWASALPGLIIKRVFAGAEMVAVSNQFFTTLMARLLPRLRLYGAGVSTSNIRRTKSCWPLMVRLGCRDFSCSPDKHITRALKFTPARSFITG